VSGETCVMRGIAGASLTSLEYIPLTLYKPYGLSLAVWVWSGDLGVVGCSGCPWPELYNSRGSFDLIDLEAKALVSRGKSLGVDIIFLHGGEPLYRPWLSCLAEEARKGGMPIGVKARLDILSSSVLDEIPRLRSLGAVLLELPQRLLAGPSIDAAVRVALDLMGRGLYAEVLVTDLVSPLDRGVREHLEGFLTAVSAVGASHMVEDRALIPIGFYGAHLEEREIIGMRRLLRSACPRNLYCYIIESGGSVYPDYIRCPKCGVEAARRWGVLVIPSASGSGCPSCGARIFYHAPHRIRRKIPVSTPIRI